jgi:peptide/nickel transport system permease protein
MVAALSATPVGYIDPPQDMAGSLPFFIVRRLVAVVLIAVAASAITFLTLHGLFPETFSDTHPLHIELWLFLERTFLHFDLGESTSRPLGEVSWLIGRGLAADASLIIGGLAAGFVLGTLAGMLAARRPRSLVARALDLLGLLALCTPVYVMAMAAIFLFAPSIGAPVPIGVFDPHMYTPLTDDPIAWARGLVVPWIIIGLLLAAVNMRLTRADLQEVFHEDYVRTATAKGLPPWAVMTRHMLPVAMPPAVSLTGAYVPLLVGNALLVESVYEIPGSFKLIPHAIDVGNYPVIQGLVIVSAVFVVACNGIADIVLATLDPRVRHSSS